MHEDTTVWITGASAGIGEALVLNWAAKGAKIIISSRNIKALELVKEKCGEHKTNITIQQLDLEQPESINKAASQVLSTVNRLDYVFLNGGLSQRSLAHETGIEVDRKMMEVNYFGNIAMTKKILPFFIKQGYGHFTITSSLTGVFGIPLRSSYAASKHALHGFFDSLRAEQTKNNINVTIACPGFIKTNISINALGSNGNPTGKMDDAQKSGISPRKCSQKMIEATINNKKEIYIGRKELIMIYFKRYLPFIYYILASRVKPN